MPLNTLSNRKNWQKRKIKVDSLYSKRQRKGVAFFDVGDQRLPLRFRLVESSCRGNSFHHKWSPSLRREARAVRRGRRTLRLQITSLVVSRQSLRHASVPPPFTQGRQGGRSKPLPYGVDVSKPCCSNRAVEDVSPTFVG